MNNAVEHLNALPPGTRIGDFMLEKSLRPGGFGITYLGQDTVLGRTVAVKEYMPAGFAVRVADMTIHPRTQDDEEDYRKGLDDFLLEARTLARFEHHPNIVRVHRFFEDHGTAYIVMEYVEGQALSKLLEAEKTLDEPRLTALLNPLLDALAEMHAHAEEFLHRDIKPGNIMLRDDGTPVLIDFGSARAAMAARSQSMAAVVSPGFSPIEQYSTRSKQGPWTDIYAVGAVLYSAMTGVVPSEAPDRLAGDDLVPTGQATAARYGKPLCDAVDWALRMLGSDRPQSIAEWREVLEGRSAPPAPSAGILPPPRTADNPTLTPPGDPSSAPDAERTSGGKGRRRWFITLGVVAALAAGGVYYVEYGLSLPWDGKADAIAEAEAERREQEEAETRTAERDALVASAVAQLEKKEYALARKALEGARALGLSETDYEELSERIGRSERQARVSALFEECQGHREAKRYEQELDCTGKVLDEDPGHTKARKRQGWLEMIVAWRKAKNQNTEGGYLEFERKFKPKFPDSAFPIVARDRREALRKKREELRRSGG